MDQIAGRSRTAKRALKDTVRAGAGVANRLVEVLQADSSRGSDDVTPRVELTGLVRTCQDAWPVEGGDAGEILRTTALLLVLRRFVRLCLGVDRPQWRPGAEVGDGATCLAELASAAEVLPDVKVVLQSFEDRLPGDLRDALTKTASATDASLPLSTVYEQLLAQFDRRQRAARGVFHTPASVANWMVRAVDQLVDSHFASSESLRFVDMGCGCGTFLAEAMRQWQSKPHAWAGAASFLGYEVIPTAHAMANWLLASEHGPLDSNNLELRWTNPLLAGEDERARILQPNTLPVLIGNPPYASFGRANRGAWIDRLLRDYKSGLAERKSNLNDDFIRFIRWGQYWIDEAGEGILTVVTSRTYLAGLTHRQMRRSLLGSFDQVYVLDLHGDTVAEPESDPADLDENVFDVRSGIAIGVFVKTGGNSVTARTKYHSLRGSRSHKLAWLRSTDFNQVPWQDSQPQPPALNFTAKSSTSSQHSQQYETFWPLTRIFRQWVSGVQTKNDAMFVDFDRTVLAERVQAWLRDYSPPPGTERPAFDERLIQPYLLAPFDRRWLYYDRRLLGRSRYEFMRHMLRPNVGLVFMRQSTSGGEYDHFLAVDCLASDRVFYSRHGAPYLAPLWLYDRVNDGLTRTANFTDPWMAAVTERTSSEQSPESVFDYVYAVVHRTRYRTEFAAELRRDFPRIPLPANAAQLQALAAIGQRLRQLHTTMQITAAPAEENLETKTRIGGYDVLERWRKPRARRPLTQAEAEYEHRLRQVLQETGRLRAELDDLSS